LQGGKLTRTSEDEPDASKLTAEERSRLQAQQKKKPAFKSGLCLDPQTQTLYSLDINAGTLTALDLREGGAGRSVRLGGRPYDVVRARNGLLYVSDWAGRAILVVHPGDLRLL